MGRGVLGAGCPFFTILAFHGGSLSDFCRFRVVLVCACWLPCVPSWSVSAGIPRCPSVFCMHTAIRSEQEYGWKSDRLLRVFLCGGRDSAVRSPMGMLIFPSIPLTFTNTQRPQAHKNTINRITQTMKSNRTKEHVYARNPKLTNP